jgi:hypothetical protein
VVPFEFGAFAAASELPDPGAPAFPAITGTLGAFLAAAWVLVRAGSWAQAREKAFRGGFWGSALGFASYGFGLLTGVY